MHERVLVLLPVMLTTCLAPQGEYTGEIKGGMRPSMKLIVMGIIHQKPKRWVHSPVPSGSGSRKLPWVRVASRDVACDQKSLTYDSSTPVLGEKCTFPNSRVDVPACVGEFQIP